MNNSDHILRCEGLGKIYRQGDQKITALSDINLTLNQAAQICIVGASGSGKSTLLHILGGLDAPTAGKVWLNGQNIHSLSARAAGLLRNRSLGFVYQFHHLLMEFTALENVAMPLLIARRPSSEVRELAADMLRRVGLSHRIGHKPSQLSGGERQRAAVARALVSAPQCLLADEPTGNLDTKTAQAIHELMLELNNDLHVSLVVATHDMNLANLMKTKRVLRDGVLE